MRTRTTGRWRTGRSSSRSAPRRETSGWSAALPWPASASRDRDARGRGCVMEKVKVEEFLQPKAMLTPGIAGGVTMLIANALWVAFSLPPRWTSLVLSFLLGLLVFVAMTSSVPLWQRAVYYLVNSLIIFAVSIGTNYVGVGLTHPPAQQSDAVQPRARMFFGDWLRDTVLTP